MGGLEARGHGRMDACACHSGLVWWAYVCIHVDVNVVWWVRVSVGRYACM